MKTKINYRKIEKVISNATCEGNKDLEQCKRTADLEAFSVDDGWTSFIVVGLGDPHGLESGEGSKDGTSDPDGAFSLWGSNDLDLHGGWGKTGDFLLHSVGNTWVHGGTSGKDVVSVKILTDVNVALHDGVVGGLVDTSSFHTEEGWLEEGFWATESFVSDGDDLSIWQFVALFEGGGGGGGGQMDKSSPSETKDSVAQKPSSNHSSIPRKDGWKRASGQRNLSFPMVMTC